MLYRRRRTAESDTLKKRRGAISVKYPKLFEPIKLGNTLFRNRIFASPQGFYNVGKDCFPNADTAAYYERKAMGGFASVSVGDCIVDEERGKHYGFLFRLEDPDSLPGFSALACSVARHGCVASCELSHAGMYAHASHDKGYPLYGPVETENQYGHVIQMDEAEIERVIAQYVKCAARAKQAGFGMITIHGGHGWLLAQFMSSKINTRRDKWGGSLENRMRLPLAVIDAIRKEVGPHFPIEFRMSGSERNSVGYDLDEGTELAKALDGKVDLIHVSAGNHEVLESMCITHPSMFLPDGCNAYLAAEIKKHVKTPVATVGAFTDPAHMEEIIASGAADVIQLGRQSLADPDFPLKARTGREDEINKCLRCNTCFAGNGRHQILQCAINPEIGRELLVRMTPPPVAKKKVLVVGGGPGGMQAAITAAQRGHEVILCEKGERLGGVLLCEDKVPFKQNLAQYLARQAVLARCAGVELRLNTEVTPEYASAAGADVIIAAIGARPAVPQITGIETAVCAEAVYPRPETVGQKVVILGAGLVGIELGIFLAGMGRQVTVLEAAAAPNVDPGNMHTLAIMQEMARLGIEMLLNVSADEISAEGVLAEGQLYPADTVIYATGQRPLWDEAIALRDCAPEFYQLGDCLAPRNIFSATQEAFTIARDIGRI